MIEGDVSAFNSIYDRYFKPVYANVYKILKSPEYTEEIVQDVFVTLWQNKHKIDPDKEIAGWLFKVSFNTSISFLKQKVAYAIDYVDSYESLGFEVTEDFSESAGLETKLQVVEKTIQLLSPRQREVLTMCKIEGKSKEEVATLLGISPETVKEHLKQSYKMIKSKIGHNVAADMVETLLFIGLVSVLL